MDLLGLHELLHDFILLLITDAFVDLKRTVNHNSKICFITKRKIMLSVQKLILESFRQIFVLIKEIFLQILQGPERSSRLVGLGSVTLAF